MIRPLALRVDGWVKQTGEAASSAPDPCRLAVLAELSGVDAIVVSEAAGSKIGLLRELVSVPLIMRLPLDLQLAEKVARMGVAQAVIEPSLVEGEDLELVAEALQTAVAVLAEANADVGVAVEPELSHVKSCYAVGVRFVLLGVRQYRRADTLDLRDGELDRIEDSVALAAKLGLGVHLGDDLTCDELSHLASLHPVEMYHVGASVLSRATEHGLSRALSGAAAALRRGGEA